MSSSEIGQYEGMSGYGEDWVKIVLTGPDGEVETPWAERVEGGFRLDNLPWFAYGIADDDIIEAVPTEDDGIFDFVRVVHSSGNRLVRIIFDDASDADPVLDALTSMGCHYEGANRRFIAVSIPPPLDLGAVTSYLTGASVRWEYAKPTYKELFPDA